MPGDMLTSREVAAYLGIHEKQVYRLLRQGRLPGTRITGRWVFSRRLVREWIEASSREVLRQGQRGGEVTIHSVEPHHLIFVGADDLLLQILQREFNRRHPALLVTSAAMNSVAGIAAVRERRAHVAGVHLLDPASGEYNRPQVAAAFDRGRAMLVTLAHRQIGLMVPHGNPRGVAGLGDVIRLRLRLASREPGSGVRVLQDHLLRELKLGKRRVAGTELALATHLEVATAIAEGRADAGLGTLAPSRSLGLDFIPLIWERYDLVTTDEAFYHRPTQAFFEMVKSDWLRQLITTLPGYDARQTGLLTVVQPDD
ncbi:MAG: helix-turn-helix transcriptional regulator [Kofleriaceae bacterium]|nr:helix-turn-helix transcriptional regulator [Kofleriaceae bacterium]MCB9572848.1 helix-turn-helix transcriptional regulator [Kofleriaceae bacterium]